MAVQYKRRNLGRRPVLPNTLQDSAGQNLVRVEGAPAPLELPQPAQGFDRPAVEVLAQLISSHMPAVCVSTGEVIDRARPPRVPIGNTGARMGMGKETLKVTSNRGCV